MGNVSLQVSLNHGSNWRKNVIVIKEKFKTKPLDMYIQVTKTRWGEKNEQTSWKKTKQFKGSCEKNVLEVSQF